MPVITVTLNCKFMRREGVINRVRRYWVLLNGRQSCIDKSIEQGNFYAANSLLGLLREKAGTTPGASAESTNQGRLNVTHLAANLALHFYLFFVEVVRLADLRFGFFYCRAFTRAAIGFVIRSASKFFAAAQAGFLKSWQATRGALIGLIGAGTRTVFASVVAALILKGFAASGAFTKWILFSGIGSVAMSGALQAAILLGRALHYGKRSLACRTDTGICSSLAFASALPRAILLTLKGGLVLDTASRTYVHIAIVPQMRYCCNYEQQTFNKPTPVARGETLTY